MRAPAFARNKTEAAKLAGMSRTTLYQLMRLSGFPAPRADGRWCVSEIRKFALRSARKLEGPHERDRLQMELLNLKIQRATRELADFEKELRDQIRGECVRAFTDGAQLIRAGFMRMRDELCPVIEGKSAREIYKVWKERERKVFEDVCAELRKKVGAQIDEKDTRPGPANVVQFSERKAVG